MGGVWPVGDGAGGRVPFGSLGVALSSIAETIARFQANPALVQQLSAQAGRPLRKPTLVGWRPAAEAA